MKFVADVNFNNHILKGLRARVPALDVIRLQDLGMGRTIDPEVLQIGRASCRERVLVQV